MLMANILKDVIAWGGAIAMMVLVFFIVKDIIGVMNGSSSMGKIVVKVIAVFILLGVMYATSSFETFGAIFKGFFEGIVKKENLPNFND